MYLLKNAFRNIERSKGRNLLMGIIIMVITISACVALTIYQSGNALIEKEKNTNLIEASFSIDPSLYRNREEGESTTIEPLSLELIQKLGTSSSVLSYYYYRELGVSSSDLTPVSYETETEETGQGFGKRPGMATGDYRLTGYSDVSYMEDFINGTKKIVSGQLFENTNDEAIAVISSELASQNELAVGDTITLYTSSEEEAQTVTIIGIYEDNSEISNGNFMGMNAMNSRNQILTNIATLTKFLGDDSSQSSKMNGWNATYYLEEEKAIADFEADAVSFGVSEAYQLRTNQEEVLEKLAPIQNLSTFSIRFLIVVLVVGAVVITVLNLLNIRERKYEIGVLRAIGMSKRKVALQMVLELFTTAMIALVIGTSVGVVFSKPVASSMLKEEISKMDAEKKSMQENFGPGNFERPSGGRNEHNTSSKIDYVSSLEVKIDGITIVQLFLISLGLTTISGVCATLFINKQEPNKILQNRG